MLMIFVIKVQLGIMCGLGLLRPRLNGGFGCDDSTAEGGMRKVSNSI